MKLNRLTQAFSACGWMLSLLLLAGCSSVSYEDPNPAKPYAFPSQRQAGATEVASTGAPPVAGTNTPARAAAVVTPSILEAPAVVMQKGDFVVVTFSDTPTLLPDHKERIRDDGNMTLIYNVTIVAAGKTVAQLQDDIRAALVPKYFKYLTVTVKAEDRFYFVGGEVRTPIRAFYYGPITVLRAIDTAGGFTDFANRKNIELRRTGGQRFKIDWYKAMKDAKLDIPVFPNDQIIVNKRVF